MNYGEYDGTDYAGAYRNSTGSCRQLQIVSTVQLTKGPAFSVHVKSLLRIIVHRDTLYTYMYLCAKILTRHNM